MNEKADAFWIKAMEIGSKMGCHQRADRSFSIKGYQFPVCARCSGILISSLAGYIVYVRKRIKLKTGILLCVPMIIDGSIQYFGIRESTNVRRFLTGLAGGIGLVTVRLNLYGSLIRRSLKNKNSRNCNQTASYLYQNTEFRRFSVRRLCGG